MTAFDWATARAGLGAWIEDTIGLSVSDMHGSQSWAGSLTMSPAVHADVLCSLVSSRSIGTDDVSTEYVEGAEYNEEIRVSVASLRELIWGIRVESRSSDPGEDSIYYLEKIRALLNASAARTMLDAAGMGFQRAGNITSLPRVSRDRAISVGHMDVFLNAYFSTDVERHGYIEHVFVETEFVDASGELYPDEFQIIGEIT